jgi:transcriptional regulator with XRE-family HTH domain
MTFEELFGEGEEQLNRDVDYRVEAFFLDIVENISSAMKRADMNLSGLAKATGVTPGRISALMRGYKKNLEIRTIVQIATALGVEPHDLCARRKTAEMLARPLSVLDGYERVALAEDGRDAKPDAAA